MPVRLNAITREVAFVRPRPGPPLAPAYGFEVPQDVFPPYDPCQGACSSWERCEEGVCRLSPTAKAGIGIGAAAAGLALLFWFGSKKRWF